VVFPRVTQGRMGGNPPIVSAASMQGKFLYYNSNMLSIFFMLVFNLLKFIVEQNVWKQLAW